MPGPYPPYVRHSQRYAAVPVANSYSDKSPGLSATATSPSLMEEALQPLEVTGDRTAAILASHLQEIVTRQDILIEDNKRARDNGDALGQNMTPVAVMGTLLAILAVLLMAYIDLVFERDGLAGSRLVWGVSVMSEVLAVAVAVLLPLVQSVCEAFGKPISPRAMKWVLRLGGIVTSILMTQGVVLMFYLVVRACWL